MSDRASRPSRVDDVYRVRSSILSDSRQRQLLAILQEHSQPLTERDLAVVLATRTQSGVTEDAIERLLAVLQHQWLPKLEAIEWIERRPEGIDTTDQFPFGEPNSSLPSLDDPDGRWEQLATVLARPHRRDVLSILARESRPISLEELADAIATHEPDFSEPNANSVEPNGERDRRSLSIQLHHVDLPRMADAGLIEYDPHEGTISRPSTGAEYLEYDTVETVAVEIE